MYLKTTTDMRNMGLDPAHAHLAQRKDASCDQTSNLERATKRLRVFHSWRGGCPDWQEERNEGQEHQAK